MLSLKGDVSIMTAKVFQNGENQAVSLPKEYNFEQGEVTINKIGDIVFLMPKDSKWYGLLQSLGLFSSDYIPERKQGVLQEREEL